MVERRDAICGEPDERRATRGDPDSRARTHLANERTFLAWLRTAITLLGLGLAASQFLGRDVLPGVPIVTAMAIGLAGCGIFVALAGTIGYFRGRDAIDQERYRSHSYMIVGSSVVVALVGLVAIVFIVLIRHN